MQDSIKTPFLQIISEDKELITYRPRLNEITGSVTATILLQQILYWWNKNGAQKFYKFKEACSHDKYTVGDSWCEELGFTRSEFDTAIKKIGQKVSKKTQKDESKFVYYNTTIDRLTYYEINEASLSKALFQLYVNQQSRFTQINNPALDLYTETTTEIKDTKVSCANSKNLRDSDSNIQNNSNSNQSKTQPNQQNFIDKEIVNQNSIAKTMGLARDLVADDIDRNINDVDKHMVEIRSDSYNGNLFDEPMQPSKPTLADKKEKWFVEFWKAYANSKDKKKCKAWYKRNVKNHVKHEEIMKGVAEYNEYLARTNRTDFKKYPHSYLNGECWNDTYATDTNTSNGGLSSNDKALWASFSVFISKECQNLALDKFDVVKTIEFVRTLTPEGKVSTKRVLKQMNSKAAKNELTSDNYTSILISWCKNNGGQK